MEQQNPGGSGKIRRFLNHLLIWSARIIEEDDEAIWSVPKPFNRAYSIVLRRFAARC